MSKHHTVSGLHTNVELGKLGLRVKSDGSVVSVRNNADSAYVGMEALSPGTPGSTDDWVSTRAFREQIRITPERFGTTGDGVADDSTGLQNAINAAVSAGVPLFIPAGTYRVTTGINITGCDVEL